MSETEHVYQSTLDESPGMADWEIEAHNRTRREKKYCKNCSHAVGDDPKFFGIGGFLTGPFCSRDCGLDWLWSDECEVSGEDLP